MVILTTIVAPTAGRALVAGHDVTRAPLAVRRDIGVAFQESVLDNELSGLENLRLHVRLWGLPLSDKLPSRWATRISFDS